MEFSRFGTVGISILFKNSVINIMFSRQSLCIMKNEMKVLKKSVPEISVYGATNSLNNVTKYTDLQVETALFETALCRD